MDVKIVKDLGYRIVVNARELQRFEHILYGEYQLEFTAFWESRREGNTFYLDRVFFPHQKNTSVFTECDGEDIIDLMITDGADITLLNGHSH